MTSLGVLAEWRSGTSVGWKSSERDIVIAVSPGLGLDDGWVVLVDFES